MIDSVPRSFSSSDAKAMEDRHSSLSIEASAKLDELVTPIILHSLLENDEYKRLTWEEI